MIVRFLIQILIKLLGDDVMMAMFFAQRVILEKTKFKDVPDSLKPQVKEILEDSGLGYLTEETA